MFNRRLTILSLLFAAALFVLVGQLYRLTVIHGSELRADAESVLIERRLLPTIRGKIIDRKGRTLAEDRPCFDVLVDYRVISGAWVVRQAAREAQNTLGEKWNELSRAQREQFIQNTFRGRYDREVEDLWRQIAAISGSPLDEITNRTTKIETRVEKMAHSIWERWRKDREQKYQTTLTLEDVKRPIREQQLPHIILERIDSSKEADFRRLAANGPYLDQDTPAVTIQSAGARTRPWEQLDVVLPRTSLPAPLRADEPITIKVDNVASLLLGKMRNKVYAEDLKRKPLRDSTGKIVNLDGYTVGDHVGATGFEAEFEDTLRGTRGVVIKHLDTDQEDRTQPTPGSDIQLTLDLRLQTRVQAILSPQFGLTVVQPWHGHESQLPVGTPLAAAAVVLDIQSGEILALVSHTPPEWEELATDSPDGPKVAHPAFVNRAISKPYPCGSIVKPLMLNAGIASGVWSVDREITCNGHYYPNDPDHFRCWIFRERFGYATHGPLRPVDAIARSCNIYFYTIADTLKQNRLVNWYRKWGVGEKFPIGISMTPGIIQTSEKIDRAELLMMGIGQGPVAWTPLHAANAYAALARGGYYFDPILVLNQSLLESTDFRRENLNLNPTGVNLALEGIHEVVHNQQYGGARRIDTNPDPDIRDYEPIFNIEGIDTWGKTGTAQVRPWPRKILAIDQHGKVMRDHKGKPILINREIGTGAHSWFVGLAAAATTQQPDENNNNADAPRPLPQYVIAVIVEWGGSGSRCAGPIANQIMQALKDEGYFN